MRRSVICALPISILLAPAPVGAWTEARPLTTEAHVRAEADGSAEVRYRIVFEIEAGWFRGFTLSGVAEDIRMDLPACRAIDGSGKAWPLRVRQGTRQQRDSFWIDIDGPNGVPRGQLVVELVWQARLEVDRTGEGVVYAWSAPPWGNGLGMVSASLELPFPSSRIVPPGAAAETEDGAQGIDDGGVVTSAGEDRARVTVSRFRLPRWSSLRVRARVLPAEAGGGPLTSPRLRPSRRAARSPAERHAAPGFGIVAGLVLVLGGWKRISTRAVARRAGAVTLDAVFPWLGRVPRFLFSLALVSAGVALPLWRPGWAAPGMLAILAGALLLARRFEAAVAMRPPGTWAHLDPTEVGRTIREGSRRRRRHVSMLDATCLRGLVFLCLATAAAVAFAMRLPTSEARLQLLLPLDLLALLLPLVLTGTRRHLPADLGALSARMLARFARRATRALRKAGGGEVSILGRETTAGGYDELRLRLVPARAPAGLVAIDLGVEIWCRTPRLALLVRTVTGSPAHALLPRLRGVAERVRSRDGSASVAIVVPGPDGHAGLLRDLRHMLRRFARSSQQPGETAAGARAAA